MHNIFSGKIMNTKQICNGLGLWASLFLAPLILQAKTDPHKVIGPQACAGCHAMDTQVMQQTHHAKAFEMLHRLPAAQEFATKMGVTKIKMQGECMNCHYTAQASGSSEKAIAGVSCESCHGGAKDWISMHPQKPLQAQAESLGWIRPKNLYALYANCYECHTTPNEKLVNETKHPAGSSFELVSWSQGEIRHCFYDGKTNAEASPAKKRILFVLGKALELEYSLRGVAQATKNDTYGQKMALRIKSAFDSLGEIKKLNALPDIDSILTAVPKKTDGSLDIRLKNSAAYTSAADQIKAATQNFLTGSVNLDLASIDSLLPKTTMGSPPQ
jgi:hypothetical protein